MSSSHDRTGPTGWSSLMASLRQMATGTESDEQADEVMSGWVDEGRAVLGEVRDSVANGISAATDFVTGLLEDLDGFPEPAAPAEPAYVDPEFEIGAFYRAEDVGPGARSWLYLPDEAHPAKAFVYASGPGCGLRCSRAALPARLTRTAHLTQMSAGE